jgi:hemerythrin-like domain-containing protein
MAINDPTAEPMECHDNILAPLSVFSRSLQAIEKHALVGFVSERESMKTLFDFIDDSISVHTRDEEGGLFPKLRRKFKTKFPQLGAEDTQVDVSEEGHRMVVKAEARMKQLIPIIEKGIQSPGVWIPLREFLDRGSWLIQAYQHHIWKENNLLFPLAEQFLTGEDKNEAALVMNELQRQPVGF